MSSRKFNIRIVLLISLIFSLLSLSHVKNTYAVQSDEQKKLTKTEFFGDYSKAKKTKTTGKIALVMWEPHFQKLQKAGFTSVIPTTRNLSIDCDEIWEIKFTDFLTKQEIKQNWNQLDITRLYWKNGKFQASVVLKQYISNPISNQKLPKPEHKITNIFSRAEIFEKIK